jgi:hypothetical protein
MATLPFNTTFYDTLYTSISSVLREKFPQKSNEDTLSWYKRLLYEFVTYLQATYEVETVSSKVPAANTKNNKKKDQPQAVNFQPTNQTLFDANIGKALDLVSQDSNFAVYLIAWWMPIITSPTDTIEISLTVDSTSTLAANVKLQKLKVSFSWTQFRLISINNVAVIDLNDLLLADPFIYSLVCNLHFMATGNKNDVLKSVQEVSTINMEPNPNPYINSTKLAIILWRLKNIMEPLFISELTLNSTLLTSSSSSSGGALTVTKANADKQASQRKRFNSQKFISSSVATTETMCVGVLQSLTISLFRTFYDYDAATIDPALFDYLFLNKLSIAL